MSLWSTRRSDRHGLVVDSIGFPWLTSCVFGVAVVLGASAGLALGPPQRAGFVLCGLMLSGVASIFIAKRSVFRRGEWISFGSARMSPVMCRCYRVGYALCGVGAALALGTLRLWAAMPG